MTKSKSVAVSLLLSRIYINYTYQFLETVIKRNAISSKRIAVLIKRNTISIKQNNISLKQIAISIKENAISRKRNTGYVAAGEIAGCIINMTNLPQRASQNLSSTEYAPIPLDGDPAKLIPFMKIAQIATETAFCIVKVLEAC